MRSAIFLLLLLITWSTSCNQPSNRPEQVIATAGGNAGELEKVLAYYRDQPLKQRAARFLISNLPYHYHFEGPGVDTFQQLFSKIITTPEERKKDLGTIWDSLTKEQVGSQL